VSGKGKGKKNKPAASRTQQQDAARRRRQTAGHGPGQRTPVPAPRTGTPGPAGTPLARPASTGGTAGQASGQRVRHYLDVSAVRIQEWLGRTPDLKFRRGGSIMLSQATGRDAWPDARLPSGTQWNEEAGDLDGVVSLVAAADGPESEVAACLADAATEVARQLRRALPYCPVQAVAGSGASYAEAYDEIERARMENAFVVDAPAPPAELMLAKPCDRCRAFAAERAGVIVIKDEPPADLCGECVTRLEAAGGTKGDKPWRSPRPEQRMKDALENAGMTVTGFPDDFEKMASAGRREADDAATQLGLIYADGNRVGEFLSAAAAAAARGQGPAKAEIVQAIDRATLDALAGAIIEVFPGLPRPPVLAHLAGGDDLMVSVPAAYAWPFTRSLIAGFGSRVASAADWPPAIRKKLPSMSAGLVFHHRSAPFPDVVHLAKGRLDAAKRKYSGREPSIAFLDLTADGGQAPPGREPVTPGALNAQASGLGQIACIPRAHRETLTVLLRLCLERDAPGRAETPPEALARRVIDLGYEPLWDVAAEPGAGAEQVRSALMCDDGAARNRLRGALDLARWWPPDPVNGPAIPGPPPPAREAVPA
jgi:hypothetical protein